jgi:glycosyltransferase involved in cell wall biosynthesis
MIVTNVGGLPELVPNDYAGYVVDVDVKALADSIVQFYAENKKEVFTANVREEKKKYSWETMYHKLLELKEQIR